ncbi:AAA ATPase [Clonorchis sinensis]|uniref:Cell division control protein n=1 Tax=Clonorchis sinensis TaxID=79923 RepID=A0A8T1MKJ6_CLOSI|nr:AAA ATPase [Clonorchis sinensis]
MLRTRRNTVQTETCKPSRADNLSERRMTRLSTLKQPTVRIVEEELSTKVPRPKRRTVPTKKLTTSHVSSPVSRATVLEHNQASPLTSCLGVDESNEQLVGREKERLFVRDFIRNCLVQNRSGNLYISGAPGTGKTAVVLHEACHFEVAEKCRVVHVNCMQLLSAVEVFGQILSSLQKRSNGKENRLTTVDSTAVENALCKITRSALVILILDEVDQLSSKSQDVLYRIFDWPSTISSNLVIIGIANALDLPERLLPRLKGKCHHPIHLAFPPYSRTELTDIVSARLSVSQPGVATKSQIDPLAIQLCARKISASTGDVRTALNICRRAIDLAAQESRACTPGSVAANTSTTPNCPTPTLRHISLALQESKGYNTPVRPATSTPHAESASNQTDIPLHHKLVIASAYLIRKQRNQREISFGQLCETYSYICTSRQLTRLEESELAAVCVLLDARGLIHFTTGKAAAATNLGTPARFRRVRLRLDDRGVEQILSDNILFSAILHLTLSN